MTAGRNQPAPLPPSQRQSRFIPLISEASVSLHLHCSPPGPPPWLLDGGVSSRPFAGLPASASLLPPPFSSWHPEELDDTPNVSPLCFPLRGGDPLHAPSSRSLLSSSHFFREALPDPSALLEPCYFSSSFLFLSML